MYFAFNIAIYDCRNEEIRVALISLMENEGFNLVTTDLVAQALRSPGNDLLPEIDERLMLRKFLIAPNKNKWSMIYPSTGWFSEVQDLGIKLSEKLGCLAMVLLVDDTYGWGYELSQKGQAIDRFHPQPMLSPTLKEKSEYNLFQEDKITDSPTELQEQSAGILTLARLSLPTPEQLTETKRHLLEQETIDLLTPEQKKELEGKLDQILANSSLPTAEQKAELAEQWQVDPSILDKPFPLSPEQEAEAEKYSGNPSIVANIFGVIEDLVVHYLSKSESDFGGELHNKMTEFLELLSIENGVGTYQDFVEDFDDKWSHLIFSRYMTATELDWREKWKENLPFVAPPLWLNEK